MSENRRLADLEVVAGHSAEAVCLELAALVLERHRRWVDGASCGSCWSRWPCLEAETALRVQAAHGEVPA